MDMSPGVPTCSAPSFATFPMIVAGWIVAAAMTSSSENPNPDIRQFFHR
jgi:hypothetical protein